MDSYFNRGRDGGGRNGADYSNYGNNSGGSEFDRFREEMRAPQRPESSGGMTDKLLSSIHEVLAQKGVSGGLKDDILSNIGKVMGGARGEPEPPGTRQFRSPEPPNMYRSEPRDQPSMHSKFSDFKMDRGYSRTQQQDSPWSSEPKPNIPPPPIFRKEERGPPQGDGRGDERMSSLSKNEQLYEKLMSLRDMWERGTKFNYHTWGAVYWIKQLNLLALPYNHSLYIENLQKRTNEREMFNFRTSTDLVLKTSISMIKEGIVDALYESEENRNIFTMLELCGVEIPVAVTIRVFAEKLAMAGKPEDRIISWVSHKLKEELKSASQEVTSRSIFVNGLETSTNTDTLCNYFSNYGKIINCYHASMRPDFATITFLEKHMVTNCIRNSPHKQHENLLMVRMYRGDQQDSRDRSRDRSGGKRFEDERRGGGNNRAQSFDNRRLLKRKEEGNAAFKSGKYNLADKIYTECVNMNTDDRETLAKIYFNRAAVNEKVGKREEGIRDCSLAIHNDPQYVRAYQRRAHLNAEAENYSEVISDYKTLIRMANQNREPTKEYEEKLKEVQFNVGVKNCGCDYYAALGVNRNATVDDIKKIFKIASLQYHPDNTQNLPDEERAAKQRKYQNMLDAYRILTDPARKRLYDSGELTKAKKMKL